MRKQFIIGVVLIGMGIVGLVVAHHYRPLPARYFVPSVPGAPTRLSKASYGVLVGGCSLLLAIGVMVGLFAAVRFFRGGDGDRLGSEASRW